MTEPFSLPSAGEFTVGCNYWASHAGTRMWSDWREDVVDEDLRKLSAAGLRTLRVFPLWPDFQPLTVMAFNPVYAHGERQLTEEEILHGGVSEEMMARFARFLDLAEKHNLGLIVGLVTGWMSGRLFAPQPFLQTNVITDATAVQWQVRFVREMVRRFRDRRAIVAWDLGNECNCMAAQVTRAEAWRWTADIVQAIRSQDPARPVVSGMHGMNPTAKGPWTIQDQAELTDMLTVHPYPPFTPHAGHDAIDTPRSVLHSVAEARFYAGIGRRPCMVEEFGTLGPFLAGPEVAARYMRSVLFSSWAHDCRAALWWCAFDQDHLEHAPYDWCACERELGLFRSNGAPKPALEAMSAFSRFLDGLPVRKLPPRRVEATCILTLDQDAWGTAYPAFILAKQAGFDVEFQYHDQAIRDSELYLVPSIKSFKTIHRRTWLELLDRVRAGATLYLSLDNGMVQPFNEPFGLTILTREKRATPLDLVSQDMPSMRLDATWKYRIQTDHATVLAREPDGNPALTEAAYGRGRLICLTAPLESMLTDKPAAFRADAAPYWRIYQRLAEPWLRRRAARKSSPSVGLTEHELDPRTRVIVAQNYSPEAISETLQLADGWKPGDCWHGSLPSAQGSGWSCPLPANDACVFTLKHP